MKPLYIRMSAGWNMADGRRADLLNGGSVNSASEAGSEAGVVDIDRKAERLDDEWTGFPPNPAESGAHWIQTDRGGVVPMWWSSVAERWFWFGVSVSERPEGLRHIARYIDGCVPPVRKPDVEHLRLRAFAIGVISDPWVWKHSFSKPCDALLPLSGYTDDAWRTWSDVSDATEGQWFVWRNPENPEDGIHVDQVSVTDGGRIEIKHGCGLTWYTECQPCRFDDEVLAALKSVEGAKSE